MKHTTILVTLIACVIFFACNPLKPSNSAVESKFHAVVSIPGTVATDMITHFIDMVQVDHRLDSMIKQTSLYKSELYKIFKMHHRTRIRLMTAAYHNTA